MTYLNRKNMRPFVFLFMVAALFTSCEDFEEKTYEMSDVEVAACALINDTLEVSIDTYDMAHLSPAWSGYDIESALISSERISSSWFDDDHLILSDIYVFTKGADTLGALQFRSLVYDDPSNTVDSVEVEYLYNASGTPSFASAVRDTVLVLGIANTPAYLNFELGLVTSSDVWHIQFDGEIVKQNTDLKLNRIRGGDISTFSSAPSGKYFADGPGYDVALEQLMADSLYLEYADSLNYLNLSNAIDAGFILWDRSGQLNKTLIFNLDEYISIFIWDSEGTLVVPIDNSISMETISYCSSVKVREVFELEEDMYLLRFRPHESAVEWSHHLAIVEGE